MSNDTALEVCRRGCKVSRVLWRKLQASLTRGAKPDFSDNDVEFPSSISTLL